MKFKDFVEIIEKDYPLNMAESWDPVGLHFGHLEQDIENVLVTLDVRPAVVEEAIEKDIDLILAYHPPVFSKVERFDLSDPQIKMYQKLLANNIAVYAVHTSMDRAVNGTNEWLAQALSLENVKHWDDPTHHSNVSLGRYGKLPKAMTRAEVINHVKKAFNLDNVITIERQAKESYKTLAIIGGSGTSFLKEINQLDVDVFITGDITYHKGMEAYEYDLLTIDVGHHVEVLFAEKMTEHLLNKQEIKESGLLISKSQVNTNPFKFE